MPHDAPASGPDFMAPNPGADYDPDAAIMQARALNALQEQMRWLIDMIAPLEKEILISADGKKFEGLVDLLGTDPQSLRKWRLAGSPDAVTVENPGFLRSGVKFDTGIPIKNLDGEFDLSTPNDRLYLEGEFTEEVWSVTLKGDQEWSDANPLNFTGESYISTHWYYPLAITHTADSLEAANVDAALSNEDVGIRLVAPDSDLTLVDSYFIDESNNKGQYMVYPTPLPGDIYLPDTVLP